MADKPRQLEPGESEATRAYKRLAAIDAAQVEQAEVTSALLKLGGLADAVAEIAKAVSNPKRGDDSLADAVVKLGTAFETGCDTLAGAIERLAEALGKNA